MTVETTENPVARDTRPGKRGDQQAWLWVDASTPVAVVDRACQSGYERFMATVDGLDVLASYQLPQRALISPVIEQAEDAAAILEHPVVEGRLDCLVGTSPEALPTSGYDGPVGLLEHVDDHDSLMRVVDHLGRVDLVAIAFKDPTNIPLELVLAEAQHTSTRVAKIVQSGTDGEVSFMTMESGADIIVLRSTDIVEVTRLADIASESARQQLPLRPATVTAVTHVPMGTRVCVDTTSALGIDEGMLIGSTSTGGLMTCSETHFLPYMNLRPFRVNAGALHLYVWGPNDRAVYLSDLRAGSEVLAVNAEGRARPVTVGRVKIERRPLLLIEAEIDGREVNTFIQDDWHVRMMGADGEIRPSAEIKLGDRLLGYLDRPGRHVGIRIDETIDER